jgi:hypothetical protein
MVIRIPVPTGAAATNLLGVAGLLLVILAIGGLAGVWWAVLAAGLMAVGLAALSQHREAAPAAEDEVGTARVKRRAG